MANYYEIARSNYVRVKDPDEWKALCNELGYEAIQSEMSDGSTLYGFLCEDGFDEIKSVPQYDENDDYTGDVTVNTLELFVPLLEADQVLVITACYHEAMRYCGGYAFAINSDGETEYVTTGEIYVRIRTKGLGTLETEAEY